MPTSTDNAQARLAAIVASSDDAIISKDLRGVITSWNPAAERLFGYSAAEAVGQPIGIIIPAARHGEAEDVLRRIARGEAGRNRRDVPFHPARRVEWLERTTAARLSHRPGRHRSLSTSGGLTRMMSACRDRS